MARQLSTMFVAWIVENAVLILSAVCFNFAGYICTRLISYFKVDIYPCTAYESRRDNLLRSYHVQFPLKPKDRIHLEAVGEIMRPTGCSLSEKQDDFEY